MDQVKKKIKTKAVKKKLLDSNSDAAVENANSKVSVGSAQKSDSAQDARAQGMVEKNTAEFNGLPEQVAQSKFKYVRHEWAGARQAFPHHKLFWYVDLFFPYAEGGPLFVDKIKNENHKKSLNEKQQIMKKLGHRYLQITSEMSLNEAVEQVA